MSDIQPETFSDEKRSNAIPAGFIFLLVFVLGGGLTVFILFMMKPRVHGNVTLSNGNVTLNTPSKNLSMQVDDCESGERREFFGVMFFDKKQSATGGRIELPIDGDAQIVLNRPDANDAIAFHKSDCTVWDVDLQRTSTSYNDIQGMAGHAHVDCTSADASPSHATGDIQFGSCH